MINAPENPGIIFQAPRKLSPVVVWFIYIATFLGLLISILIIFVTQDNSKNKDAQLIKERAFKFNLVTEENYIEFDFRNFVQYLLDIQFNCRDISWIDGSNDEISYRNYRGDIMVMNVASEESYLALKAYHIRQYGVTNFRVSPDKSHVAILWDQHKPYRTNPEYRVSIREFGSGVEKKILKHGDFVSYFSFSAHNYSIYTYTYITNGVPKYYECFLNDNLYSSVMNESCKIGARTGYKFLWNWWLPDQKKDYSVSAMCPSHEAYWNDDQNSCLNDTIIDEIIYQEKGTVLLYPTLNNFSYNRAIPKTLQETKLKNEEYKPTFFFSVDGEKNWIPELEEFKGINTKSFNSQTEFLNETLIRAKGQNLEENKITKNLEKIENLGMNRQHMKHISRSYCRTSPINLVSVDYTVDYSNENAVFYSLQGKNNSYYFPSKEKAFFIEPAYGTIQLDTTPWVLHPIVYRNETTGLSTFNMAISTSLGFNQNLQDTTYGYGPFFSFWNTIPKNRYLPLLSSEYFLTRILNVRKDKETDELFAYFIAAPTSNASRRYFYKIKIKYPHCERSLMESVICLTCPTLNQEGGLMMSLPGLDPQCIWADVEMSYLADYYLLNCKGPEVPWSVIVDTQTNLVLYDLKENEDIRAWDASLKKPRVHEFEIKLDKDFMARVRIYFPPEWQLDIEQCPRKYKLLVHVDGTPEGQLVTSKYEVSWFWHLILKENFLVLEADVRGSGFQSIDMSSAIWRDIGTLEVQDQITVVQHVLKQIDCIDENQVGIYGEDYGGYTALNIMALDHHKIFKCCAAVSPITAWQHYSYFFGVKIFGGVYDDLHKARYQTANIASRVRGLKHKDFIIYSGTMDREILRYHVHNLLIALANNGIIFKHQQYIDQGHDIPDYRLHLYEHMSQYFIQCFAENSARKTNHIPRFDKL